MNHDSGADAQVVLVIVASVVKSGQQVVRFDESHRESRSHAQIEAAAEVRRKGRARVCRSRIRPLNQRSARVRDTEQHLAKRLKR